MNPVKKELDNLFGKEMDRLTFIKHIGVGFGAILGVSAVVKSMTSLASESGSSSSRSGNMGYGYGYGASAYGGGKQQKVL